MYCCLLDGIFPEQLQIEDHPQNTSVVFYGTVPTHQRLEDQRLFSGHKCQNAYTFL